MNSHLSSGDRWRIISLSLDQGATLNQIAAVINCSRATVFNILQLFHETNNGTLRQGRGRTLLNNRRRIQDNIKDNMDFSFTLFRQNGRISL
ncbi:unnamed protein product [Rotaria sordida]|uniref:Uncharacterized protein n=1 Tax=Rotaria sordida TaxID=392033 RepID=A0A819DDC5_9BILA|nr:unnamed protein product [Rotaria sordida]